MTFVTCAQFQNSQAAQDEKLNKLEECCQKGTEKNAEQDKAISALQNGALSADDALVDKAGVSDGQGKGTGKITVAKVKEAIEGDVAVAVDAKKGLSGNGKSKKPLAVNAKEGDFKFNAQTGALELGGNALQADNIGNGLKYDPKTGKYIVDAREANGVKTNPDGSVGLAVSPDEGNQLQLRPNGIYYGLVAPEDKRYLYVSTSLGNDDNKGSYDSPLKTIEGAFRVIANSGQHHEIRLRAGETFRLGRNYAEQTSISITSYYDQPNVTVDWWQKLPFYRPESSTAWLRPIILVKKEAIDAYNVHRDRISCRMFYGTGLHFELDDTDPQGMDNANGNIPGFINAINSIIQFEGCTFRFSSNNSHNGKYRRDAWLRVKGVTMLNCKFYNKPDDIKNSAGEFSRFVYHVYYPSINQNVWIDDLDGKGIFPTLTPIVANEEDMRNILTLDNICTELKFDRATKTIFGCLPTWDIFNYS